MEDRRIIRSQEAIKEAFLQILSEKKFDNITIKDITDKANIGRRTFYNHYIDKYDLVENMIEEHINRLHEICRSSVDYDSKNGDVIWFDYFKEHYQFFFIMLSNGGKFAFREKFLKFVIDELREYIDRSKIKQEEINEELYLTFCASAIVGVVEIYFIQNPWNIDSEKFANQVMILLDKSLY